MRRIINSIILLAIMAIALPSYGQGLKAFKLKNGLSVYIWEDNTKSDVYGIVACRTGSVNDPAEYTGLAHYLEHVMFKGTDKIGALDWATEKPLYDPLSAPEFPHAFPHSIPGAHYLLSFITSWISLYGTCVKIFLSSSAISKAIAIFVKDINEICPVASNLLIEP